MKSRVLLNTFLLVVFIVSVTLNWLGPPDPGRRNIEYFPNMAHSARYAAFSPNPEFPDGKTLQQPEPGAIPRGYRPVHYKPTPEDALRAGEELQNPFAAAPARHLDRGTFVFTTFCQACHGAGGTGNGTVALRRFPAPASLVAVKAVKMKDGQMFHVLTYGQGNMPSYATQLSPEDRWNVILYVRSLQEQAAGQAPTLSPAQPALTPSHGGQP